MENDMRVQRAIKKITQEELAERIGVSRQTIHAVETGKFVPSTVLAIRLAEFFKIRVEQLFWLSPEEKISYKGGK